MNKRITFLAMILVISTCVFPQTWPKIYSTGSSQSADETYDHGFIILGNLGAPPSYPTHSGLLIKSDINGEVLWKRILGRKTNYFTNVQTVKSTTDSGLLISLNTKYKEIDPFGGYNDATYMKINACGQLDWCEIINKPGIQNRSYGLIETYDGYVGLHINKEFPIHSNSLIKFDYYGQIQWMFYYGNDQMEQEDFRDIIELKDSSLLITGFVSYSDSLYDSHTKPVKLHIDHNGNLLDYQVLFMNNDMIEGAGDNQTIESSRGCLYSAGSTNLSDESMRKHYLSDQDQENFLIGNTMSDSYSLCWMQDSTIAIAGIYSNAITGYGIFDITIVDSLGLIHNRRQLYSNTNNACYLKLINTFENKIIATGPVAITAYNYNTNIYLYKLTSDLENDVFDPTPREYDYACPDGVALNDTIGMEECDIMVSAENLASLPDVAVMEVYPNPVRDQFQVRLPEFVALRNNNRGINTALYQSNYQQYSMLQVFNVSGRLIKEQKLTPDQMVAEFDASDCMPGMYLVRLVYKDKTVGSAKVVR